MPKEEVKKPIICYDCHKEIEEDEVMWVDVGKKQNGTRVMAPCHRDECIRWGGCSPPPGRRKHGKKHKSRKARP